MEHKISRKDLKPTSQGAKCIELTCDCGWKRYVPSYRQALVLADNHIVDRKRFERRAK